MMPSARLKRAVEQAVVRAMRRHFAGADETEALCERLGRENAELRGIVSAQEGKIVVLEAQLAAEQSAADRQRTEIDALLVQVATLRHDVARLTFAAEAAAQVAVTVAAEGTPAPPPAPPPRRMPERDGKPGFAARTFHAPTTGAAIPAAETREAADRREVRELLAAGMSARAIAAETDLPLGQVATWTAEWRAEQAAARGAPA